MDDIFDGYAREDRASNSRKVYVNPVMKDAGYGYNDAETLSPDSLSRTLSYQDMEFDLADEQYAGVKEIVKWLYENPRYRKPFMRLSGLAGCLDENSIIQTNYGVMTLRDIILQEREDLDFVGFQEFKEMGGELKVLSHDNTWNSITDIYATEDNTLGYDIITATGNTIKGSYRHPLYCLDSMGNYIWKQMDELVVGDKVAVAAHKRHEYNIDSERSEEMYVLGYYFADGCLSWNESKYHYAMSFASADKEFLQASVDRILALFPGVHAGNCKFREDKNNYMVVITNLRNNPEFCEFVDNHIDLSDKKRINVNSFTNTSSSDVIWFLKGLFRDLSIESPTQVTFSNVLYDNVLLVKQLLHTLGINTGDIRFHSNKYNGTYRFTILTYSLQNFVDIFGYMTGKKAGTTITPPVKINTNINLLPNVNALLKEAGGAKVFNSAYSGCIGRGRSISYEKFALGVEHHPNVKNIVEDNYFWDQIVSIEEVQQKFYDISVKDTSSFIANSFVSHNTGKSAIISYIISQSAEIFPSYMRMRPPVICTFTWKAALVLRSRNVDACSIHSIFYEPNGSNKNGEVSFKRRPPEVIRETYSMIIVDEASMVNSEMRGDIESIGLPVLYVGDHGQLPAISTDPEDETFMEKSEIRLTEIHRQALDSPIIRLAMDIRNGKYIPYGKYGEGVFKVSPDEISNNVLVKTDQLICGRNDTRRALNNKVRRLLGHDIRHMPTEGERLIGLNNLPDKQMFNGQALTCTSDYSEFKLEHSSKTVMRLERDDTSRAIQQCWFPDDVQYKSFPRSSNAARFMKENGIHLVDFGYAITCHKSQGSAVTRPVIFEERLGDAKFHRKWLYTAVTRATKKVFIVSID